MLSLLLVSLALLFAIARRFGGTLAGAIAAGILALHYTADIPVRWACGSQELFAVSGALAAILLHLQGRTRWAGVMLLIAALSKEVILLTPAIAVFADRRAREPWSAAVRTTATTTPSHTSGTSDDCRSSGATSVAPTASSTGLIASSSAECGEVTPDRPCLLGTAQTRGCRWWTRAARRASRRWRTPP